MANTLRLPSTQSFNSNSTRSQHGTEEATQTIRCMCTSVRPCVHVCVPAYLPVRCLRAGFSACMRAFLACEPVCCDRACEPARLPPVRLPASLRGCPLSASLRACKPACEPACELAYLPCCLRRACIASSRTCMHLLMCTPTYSCMHTHVHVDVHEQCLSGWLGDNDKEEQLQPRCCRHTPTARLRQ